MSADSIAISTFSPMFVRQHSNALPSDGDAIRRVRGCVCGETGWSWVRVVCETLKLIACSWTHSNHRRNRCSIGFQLWSGWLQSFIGDRQVKEGRVMRHRYGIKRSATCAQMIADHIPDWRHSRFVSSLWHAALQWCASEVVANGTNQYRDGVGGGGVK